MHRLLAVLLVAISSIGIFVGARLTRERIVEPIRIFDPFFEQARHFGRICIASESSVREEENCIARFESEFTNENVPQFRFSVDALSDFAVQGEIIFSEYRLLDAAALEFRDAARIITFRSEPKNTETKEPRKSEFIELLGDVEKSRRPLGTPPPILLEEISERGFRVILPPRFQAMLWDVFDTSRNSLPHGSIFLLKEDENGDQPLNEKGGREIAEKLKQNVMRFVESLA